MNESLKTQFKIDEDVGFVPDQIKARCNAEDNYTWAKGYPLIKEVQGKLGRPMLELIKQEVIIN